MQSNNAITLIHGDAFEQLALIPTGSVDCVLTDPPYGTTDAAWDKAPDWGLLFAELWRVLKHNGALLMFAQNPLAAELIVQQRRYFRYEWVWEKPQASGILNAKKMPLRAHELVLVFYRKLPTYNAALIESQRSTPLRATISSVNSELYGKKPPKCTPARPDGYRCPRDVIRCGRDVKNHHSTQKPLALLRDLLRQYCSPGDLVLDPFAGSGSTLVAARELGLRAIGIEITEHYYHIARARLAEQLPLAVHS